LEHSFWYNVWEEGELGFNQIKAHPSLKNFFPKLASGARVLVPLCGKSIDMLWLAEQGYSVTGIELVEDAVIEFFEENQIAFNKTQDNQLAIYQATDLDITLVAGDFFSFSSEPFDALYDRAALVALPDSMRADYVNHCRRLLKENARVHLVVFDYDTSVMDGPPFSLPIECVHQIWGDQIKLVNIFDMLTGNSRFKDGGFSHFNELVFQY